MTDQITETAASSTAANSGDKWVERFGKLVNVVVRQDKKGADFVTFGIQAPKFTQRGIAFGETAQKIIAAKDAEQTVWAKGPIVYKEIAGKDGEMVKASDFTAIYFNIRAPKAQDAAQSETAVEETVSEEAAESAFA